MKKFQIFLFLISCFSLSYAQKLRVCGYPSQQMKLCKQIGGQKLIECVDVQDSVDCALKIKDGKADFGAFYPEQAILATKFINDDVSVIGEIRHMDRTKNQHSFRTVVVVKSDHTGGLNGMRGKSYCHFGFDSEPLMTKRAKQEFENALIDIQETCEEKSLAEKEIIKLSNLFTKACRPGTWVEDPELDTKLKSKYSNLCDLCDDQSKCKYYDTSNVTQKSLECLTRKGAQVAYTTFEAVQGLIREQPNVASNLRLLCRNGQTREISSAVDDDCTWRNQPWTLIFAKKEKAADIQKNLGEWIDPAFQINVLESRKIRDTWQDILRKVLNNGNDELRFLFDSGNVKSPNDFFLQNKQDLVEMRTNSKCEMKWCTVGSLEQEKCTWLSTAMELQGMKTKMNCIKGTEVLDCLRKIREDKVDAMAIDSHYGYIARKFAHVRTLMNFEETSQDTSVIFAVIRADSGITSFSDLKGKKACFPEYRGIAWLAFIQRGRELKQLPDSCEFGKVIGDYFNDTCAPGVDEMHYRSAGADTKKLCSLCRSITGENGYCQADTNNKYFNNSGSITCLTDSAADVAFVELREIDKNADMQNLKVLCRDGKVADIDLNNLNEDCAIIATVNSEVVSKTTNKGNPDFVEILKTMDNIFGTASSVDDTMDMYASFRGFEDLMFKTTSVGITDTKSTESDYVKNYRKMFDSVDKCSPNSSNQIFTTALLVFLVSIINIFNF